MNHIEFHLKSLYTGVIIGIAVSFLYGTHVQNKRAGTMLGRDKW